MLDDEVSRLLAAVSLALEGPPNLLLGFSWHPVRVANNMADIKT